MVLFAVASNLVGCANDVSQPEAIQVNTRETITVDPTPVPCEEWGGPFPAVDSPYFASQGSLNQPFSSDGVISSYHLFDRGIDYSKPVRIVVRLHGDGAQEFDDPAGLTACLAAVANQHNAILVVPRSPDFATATWWEDIPTNRRWLGELLAQRIFPRFGLRATDTVWVGYSGGSEMLTAGILPHNPEWVGLGALMISGGSAPESVEKPASGEQLATLPLAWIVGANDHGEDNDFDAVAAARSGAQFYRDQGFERVTDSYLEELDHYDMPQADILEQFLGELPAGPSQAE